MSKTVLALYDELEQAHGAVHALTAKGFDRDNISLVIQDVEEQYATYDEEATVPEDSLVDGMATGTILGGLTGMVVGLFALVIPGVGPAIAAGPIAAALAGTGAGAIVGGLVGALTDMGIEEETAHYYVEGLNRGGILVAVTTTDSLADEAAAVLATFEPVDLEARAAEWSIGTNEKA